MSTALTSLPPPFQPPTSARLPLAPPGSPRMRAASTRRDYWSNWVHFECWCTAQGFTVLPTVPAIVGLYLAAHEGLSVATLSWRVSSIGAEHRLAGQGLDVQHPAIADVLRGCAASAARPSGTPRL